MMAIYRAVKQLKSAFPAFFDLAQEKMHSCRCLPFQLTKRPTAPGNLLFPFSSQETEYRPRRADVSFAFVIQNDLFLNSALFYPQNCYRRCVTDQQTSNEGVGCVAGPDLVVRLLQYLT